MVPTPWRQGGAGGTNGSAGTVGSGDGWPDAATEPNYEGNQGYFAAFNPAFAAGGGGQIGFPASYGASGGVWASTPGHPGFPGRLLPGSSQMRDPGAIWRFFGGSSGSGGDTAGAGSAGGTGGWGGGIIYLRSRHVANTAPHTLFLNARGGHGKAGSGGTGAGGGGGGNPGWISISSDDAVGITVPAGVTTAVTPGTGGAGSGTGTAGRNAGATGVVMAAQVVA
jgi:hypothetical protein